MLCPSCRRQLERGASYCGSCGAPLNGAPAPLELVLDGGQRVPMVSELTIGRAPGSTLVLSRPVGVAHARADHGRRGAGGHRLLPWHVAGRGARDGAVAAARRGEDPARRRGAAGGAPARRGRGGADDVRARGRDRVHAVDRRQRDAVRDAPARAVRLRAQAAGRVRGAPAVGAEGSAQRARSCGSRTTTRGCSSCFDGTHSLLELVAMCEQRFGATGSARLVRLLTDLGERGFLSGVAGSTPAGEAPTSWWRKLVRAAREDLHRARPEDRGALPQRRLGVLHAPGADRAGRAGRARAGVLHLPDRRALRDAVRRGVEARPGRARVPARALRGRGRARDRARADDGVVRAARGQGRA